MPDQVRNNIPICSNEKVKSDACFDICVANNTSHVEQMPKKMKPRVSGEVRRKYCYFESPFTNVMQPE